MSICNSTRSGCRDVFHAFLVKDAIFESELEIPSILPESDLPGKLTLFSQCLKANDHDSWVCFYEDDVAFERLWNNPSRYLPVLKRFGGVITPDFSLYRDMPLVEQLHNIYRSRALGHWLQRNGVPAVANVRWGDERTFEACCAGVPKNSTIAVGSHGCIKLNREREFFADGLEYVVKELTPKCIIVYGTAPDSIFGKYKEAGITILQFDSNCMEAHRKAVSC